MKWSSIGILLFIAINSTGLTSHHAYADDPPKDRKYYETHKEIFWDKPIHKKWIALTFDDGPSSGTTGKLLSLLQQYQAKATFFCLGYKVNRYPKIAKSIVVQGHEIANHTYFHFDLNRLTGEKLDKEIKMTQTAIEQVTGVKPYLFRPPGGVYNDQVVSIAKKHQLRMIMWSWDQDTKDWSNRTKKSSIVNKVIRNASNGDIVLFHDLNEKTVLALKEILPELKKRGYQFVTVSQLLQAVEG
ncbi:polysaccharide deacetylase family protein [Shimazuella sp. AN120528]|uniref:polysaccharide deacetylase family protein n=1 Tax=Shimazuella soli TaxID=1892854 RepID=UPI001F0D00B2|nr:polysaccharide deacetylase family protein [Shimazuella soli]MCH5586045.1 polysaccharide deacetylase family protein [Shimazuella soli]